MKKTFSTLLAVTLISTFVLFSSAPVTAATDSGNCGADGKYVVWSFYSDTGTLLIEGSGDMIDYSDASSTPWDKYRKSIQNVAFFGSVTSIGSLAFYGCSNLENIILPSSLTTIKNDAFCNCATLKNIIIPKSIYKIGSNVFEGCSSLVDIYCETSKKPAGWNAQWFGNSTADIHWSSAVHSGKCGASTDNGDKISWQLNETDGVLTIIGAGKMSDFAYDNYEPWYSYLRLVKTVNLYGEITSIGRLAFSGCNNLTSVTIPKSIKSIGKEAFDRCSKLTSIYIPSSVKNIDDAVFDKCSSLKNIYCEAEEKPSDWNSAWIGDSKATVAFGHKHTPPKNTPCNDSFICTECNTLSDPVGHKYIENVVIPTCEERGYTLYKCSVCGDEYKDSYVNEKGHSIVDTVIAPTCIEKGYTLHECSACDLEYKDTYVDAKGHTAGEWIIVKDAEIGESGLKEQYCRDCKILLATETIPALKAKELIGDVNGDGNINSKDYILLKRYCLKTVTLSLEQLLRSDINQDGTVNSKDYSLLKRHCLKTYTIIQPTA